MGLLAALVAVKAAGRAGKAVVNHVEAKAQDQLERGAGFAARLAEVATARYEAQLAELSEELLKEDVDDAEIRSKMGKIRVKLATIKAALDAED